MLKSYGHFPPHAIQVIGFEIIFVAISWIGLSEIHFLIFSAAVEKVKDELDEDEDEYPSRNDGEDGPKIKINWPKPERFGDNGDSTPSTSGEIRLEVGGSRPGRFNEEITNPGRGNEDGSEFPIIPPKTPQQVEGN